jgi:hypothetical protein
MYLPHYSVKNHNQNIRHCENLRFHKKSFFFLVLCYMHVDRHIVEYLWHFWLTDHPASWQSPCSRVFIEKLILAQLANNYLMFKLVSLFFTVGIPLCYLMKFQFQNNRFLYPRYLHKSSCHAWLCKESLVGRTHVCVCVSGGFCIKMLEGSGCDAQFSVICYLHFVYFLHCLVLWCGTWKFFTIQITAHHQPLSWGTWVQPTSSFTSSLSSILIVSQNSYVGLLSHLFHSGFPTKTFCLFLFPHTCCIICPSHDA